MKIKDNCPVFYFIPPWLIEPSHTFSLDGLRIKEWMSLCLVSSRENQKSWGGYQDLVFMIWI
jgi:hypothetical protein